MIAPVWLDILVLVRRLQASRKDLTRVPLGWPDARFFQARPPSQSRRARLRGREVDAVAAG